MIDQTVWQYSIYDYVCLLIVSVSLQLDLICSMFIQIHAKISLHAGKYDVQLTMSHNVISWWAESLLYTKCK